MPSVEPGWDPVDSGPRLPAARLTRTRIGRNQNCKWMPNLAGRADAVRSRWQSAQGSLGARQARSELRPGL